MKQKVLILLKCPTRGAHLWHILGLVFFLFIHHTEVTGHGSILRLHTATFCIPFIGSLIFWMLSLILFDGLQCWNVVLLHFYLNLHFVNGLKESQPYIPSSYYSAYVLLLGKKNRELNTFRFAEVVLWCCSQAAGIKLTKWLLQAQ